MGGHTARGGNPPWWPEITGHWGVPGREVMGFSDRFEAIKRGLVLFGAFEIKDLGVFIAAGSHGDEFPALGS